MNLIQVQEPGLFTTVQDLGREGFGPMGVSASGAADAISLRLGNRLVGNAEGAAGLEMTLLGGTFVFPEGALLALTGSDFGATLEWKPVELWSSFEAKAGQALRLGPTRSGARCYLCVRGGVEVKLFLGSASTHILSGLGGHDGRALRKGDVLRIGAAKGATRKGRLTARALKRVQFRKDLRVTDGPQGAAPAGGAMISEGVSLGAVQVPEGGRPIILFVEQQTTGGYPKIANVISADFHSLGQLRPRDEIRFERVGREAARALLRDQEDFLASEELVFE